nr:unnamed protein product [Callosobruchus chinensis]
MVHHGNLVGRYFTGRPKSVCVQLGLLDLIFSCYLVAIHCRVLWVYHIK